MSFYVKYANQAFYILHPQGNTVGEQAPRKNFTDIILKLPLFVLGIKTKKKCIGSF